MPYPAPPAARIAYDRDGTTGVRINTSNLITDLSGAQLQTLNDEAITALDTDLLDAKKYAFIFPELRDILGYFVSWDAQGGSRGFPGKLEKSVDSTNGLDGTWVQIVDPFIVDSSGSVNPAYRTAIQSISALGIKALRFSQTWGGSGTDAYAIHLYGNIASGQNPNRLQIWRASDDATPNLEADSAYLDWGDVARSSSATKYFRVRNNAATFTANGVIVSADILTDGTPSVPGQFLFKLRSASDATYAATLNLGNVAASTISVDIAMKRTTPSNAQLGAFAPRLKAEATSWS